MIRTNKKISIPIDDASDDASDDLVFNMTILSRSKLNKWDYINLIVAIGGQIDISNGSSHDFEIFEIGLALKTKEGEIDIYSSDKLKSKLPIDLKAGNQTSIFFEGHSFIKVLSFYKNETAVIYAKCKSATGDQMFKSEEFIGDGVESKLEKLKQKDLANWAQEDFVQIDAEPIFVSSENI